MLVADPVRRPHLTECSDEGLHMCPVNVMLLVSALVQGGGGSHMCRSCQELLGWGN